jgi:hypothetical protein
VYAYGDTVIIDSLEATVQQPVEDTQAASSVNTDTIVMVFDVMLVNSGSQPKDYSSQAFEAFDADSYGYSALEAASKQPLGSGIVGPGKTVRGFVAFKIPVQATLDRVVWTPRGVTGPQAIWH